MAEKEHPDVYICALLAQMINAREGDVSHEFQEVVSLITRLRGYDEEQALQQMALALDMDARLGFDGLVSHCKQSLNDDQLRDCIGMIAYLARMDGEVSSAEETVFTRLCLGLGVEVSEGRVEIRR